MGTITLAGSLADGTAISQSSVVSQDGYWPLYVNLYGGKGSLWGWNYFTNNTHHERLCAQLDQRDQFVQDGGVSFRIYQSRSDAHGRALHAEPDVATAGLAVTLGG